jgi:hypothetical protein
VQQQLRALRDVAELLERSGFDYWLFGGWAVDFHVGAITRPHDDVDLAVWHDAAAAAAALLEAHGWQHAPEPDEDGGTGYERGPVRVEITYLKRDDSGRIVIPLRDRDAVWSEGPLGNEVRELLGVRVRVAALSLLKAGKSSPRDDPGDAAKDRADYEALSALSS